MAKPKRKNRTANLFDTPEASSTREPSSPATPAPRPDDEPEPEQDQEHERTAEDHDDRNDNLFAHPAHAAKWAADRTLSAGARRLIAEPSAYAPDPNGLVFTTLRFPDTPDAECALLLGATTRAHLREPGPLPALAPRAGDGEGDGEADEEGPAFTIGPSTDSSSVGGLGVHAARNLPPGSVIAVERPLLVSPAFMLLRGLALGKRQLYRTLVDRLPEAQQGTVRGLANCHGKDECGSEEGIVRTNGVAVELDTPREMERTHSAVFATLSRCNHSCSPNAAYRWDPRSFSLTLFTLRLIPSEDEILIAYTPVLAPRADRQRVLLASYKFTCECAACSRTNNQTKKADTKRGHIRTAREAGTFKTAFARWHAADAVNRAKIGQELVRVLGMIEQEDLQVYLALYKNGTDALARIRGVEGNRQVFVEAVERARRAWHIDAALEVASRKRVRTYERWLERPGAFKHWGGGE